MTPSTISFKPLTFTPLYKTKLWGGQNLKKVLSKDIPENSPVGESWELSGYGSDASQCITPGFDTFSLQRLFKHYPNELAGAILSTPFFPLLFKFIDAQKNLSVQVHPDDTQACTHGWGDFGKTECWYVVDAKPPAEIIIGFKNGVTKADIIHCIEDNSLGSLLNRTPITKGDVLFIPAGTVHAILGGTLLFEVQETSDTTFRLYDWGRVDSSGTPRELHINEALHVLDTSYHTQHKITPVIAENSGGVSHTFRAVCRYFALEEYTLEPNAAVILPEKNSFAVISVLNGTFSCSAANDTASFSQGQTVLIPAACFTDPIRIIAREHTGFLLTTVPDLRSEVIDYLRKSGATDATIQALGGHPSHNDLLPLM